MVTVVIKYPLSEALSLLLTPRGADAMVGKLRSALSSLTTQTTENHVVINVSRDNEEKKKYS